MSYEPGVKWRDIILEEMQEHGDGWENEVAFSGDRQILDADARAEDYRSGCAWTLWTKSRIYFPFYYDCTADGVISVPREPCQERCMVGC